MLGISNLKKLVDLGLKIGDQIAEVLQDGKVSWLELPSFLDEALAIPGVVSAWDDIKAEFKDLTPEERLDLHTHVADKFDIPNDQVEAFVEDALLQAISIIHLVERFKELKKPPEVEP